MEPVAASPVPDKRKQLLLEWTRKKEQRQRQAASPARATPAEAERHERILQQRRQNMAPPSMSPARSSSAATTPRQLQPPPQRRGTTEGYRQRFLLRQGERMRRRRRAEDQSDAASNPLSDETGSQPSTQPTDTESDAPRRRDSTEFESGGEDMDVQRPRSEFERQGRLPTRLRLPTVVTGRQTPARSDEGNGAANDGAPDTHTDLQTGQQQDPGLGDLQTEELYVALPPSPPPRLEVVDTEMAVTEEINETQRLQQQATEVEAVEDQEMKAADEEQKALDEEMPDLSLQELVKTEEVAELGVHSTPTVPEKEEAAQMMEVMALEPPQLGESVQNVDDEPLSSEPLMSLETTTDELVDQERTEKRVVKRRGGCWFVLLASAGLAVVSVVGSVAVCRVYPSSLVAMWLRLTAKGTKEVVYPLVVEAHAMAKSELVRLEAAVLSAWKALLEHEMLEKAARAVGSLENGDLSTWKAMTQSVKTTAATVSSELTWSARMQLETELAVLAGALTQTFQSVQATWSEFVESKGLTSDTKDMDISSERLLEPLEKDKAAMRKMREQLLEQEAWALQELKRFKNRRTSTATAVDSIMADTRTAVMKSIYESKLAATQYVEEHTQQLAMEFMQSLEKDLEEYDLALQEAETEGSGVLLEEEAGGAAQLETIFSLKRQLQKEASAFVEQQAGAESSNEDEIATLKVEEVRASAEQECLSSERAEAERLVLEQERLDAERLAAEEERAEAEREAAEQKLLEDSRLVAERAQEERLAAERKRVEEERVGAEHKRVEEERVSAESKRAEEERVAAERRLAEEVEAIRTAALKEEEEVMRVEAERIAALEELATLAKLEEDLLEAERLKAQAEELARVEQAEKNRLADEQEKAKARTRTLEQEEKRKASEQLEVEEAERAAVAKQEAERLEALQREEAEMRAQMQEQKEELAEREVELQQLKELEAEAEAAILKDEIVAGVNDKLATPSGWRESRDVSSVALPSVEVVQMGAISMAFLAVAVLAGYFMMRLYKSGVLCPTSRRRVLPPRRKRWQRPAVSESEDSEAEEVVLMSYASPGEDDAADSDDESGDNVADDASSETTVPSSSGAPEIMSSDAAEVPSAQLSSEGEVKIKEEVLSDEEHKEEKVEEVIMPGTESSDSNPWRRTRFQTTSYTDDKPAPDPAESLTEATDVHAEPFSPLETDGSRSAELSTIPGPIAASDAPVVAPSGASTDETLDTAQRGQRRWNLRSST